MINNRIYQIHFRVDGWNSNSLIKSFTDEGIDTQLTLRNFSTGGYDLFDLFLALTPTTITAFVGVLIAFVKRGKQVSITYDTGQVKHLEAKNYKVEELIKLVDGIKKVDVSN
ncbi:hypothetical protein [Yersinia sp. 1652 StPb PI]|uniref:hypothetical protein n=1 Tax=Yersinia sp. 1652 StPb PI TaxID=3061649 RepID=UPI00355BE6ED